jgi:hypothetical protein
MVWGDGRNGRGRNRNTNQRQKWPETKHTKVPQGAGSRGQVLTIPVEIRAGVECGVESGKGPAGGRRGMGSLGCMFDQKDQAPEQCGRKYSSVI